MQSPYQIANFVTSFHQLETFQSKKMKMQEGRFLGEERYRFENDKYNLFFFILMSDQKY